MNPNERETLENFLNQLVQVRGTLKIPEAETMIGRAVDRQPDADYLLVQRSLILQQALEQARSRIAELELAQEHTDRGFLDAAPSSPPVAMPAAQGPQAARPGLSPPSQSPFPAGPPVAPELSRGGGAASFLGQAAATAAGVAGGEFLFEGLENLFSPHGASALGHEAQAPIPEDVTINNYYTRNEGGNQASGDQPDWRADDAPAEDDDSALDDDDADLI